MLLPFTMKLETNCCKYVPQISHKFNGRDKGYPISGHKGQEGEYMYKSILSLTSAIDEGVWSKSPPGRLTPKRERRGTHCTGRCLGLIASLCGFRKNHHYRDSIPGPSSPYRVALRTKLFLPTSNLTCFSKVRPYQSRF